jgi:ketosteroid isomerase-like protein
VTRLPLVFIALAGSLSAQRPDTSATKATLLAEDVALAATVAARGAGALVDRLAPQAPVNFPDAPIYRGAAEGGAPFAARYAAPGTRISWAPQHAIVSTDGAFGCTVGTTQMTVVSDTSRAPRNGRYITCWTRAGDGKWSIAGHARNGETAGIATPNALLNRPPHSATEPGSVDALRAAIDADAAFAKLSVDSGPATAFVRYAASDAMLLGGRAVPPRGPVQIRPGFADFPSAGRFAWAPVRTLGAAGGGLAFTVGESTITQDGKESRGKYITVWRQERDGHWKYVFDLGSPRP